MSSLTICDNLIYQIKGKEEEITGRQEVLDEWQTSLNGIAQDLSMSSNFTQEQLDELDAFLVEGDDYIDETYCATDTMTESEILDMKLQLFNNASEELAKKSRPQYTITTTLNNILTIQDGKDAKISYKDQRSKFVTGNMITLKYRDDFIVGIRLMSLELDFNKKSDIPATFSDKSRLDDELTQLAEVLAQSNRSATTVSYEKIGWNNASSYTNEFKTFKNGMLDLAVNALKTNDGQKPLIDEYGIHMYKLSDDGVSFSPYQAQLTNNQLLFTNDAWKSSVGGIGVFTDSTGAKSMSIFAK
jgi:hypothetical protein